MGRKVVSEAEKASIALHIKEQEAYLHYLQGFTDLQKSHGLDTPITWDEIRAIQEKYAADIAFINLQKSKVESAIKSSEKNKPHESESDTLQELRNKANEEVSVKIEKLQRGFDGVLSVINANFAKFNTTPNKAGANLMVDATSKKNLAIELLQKNSGLAIADLHTQEEAPNFIADNMAAFKKTGLDTIYLESDNNWHNFLCSLDTNQLKTLLKDRRLDNSALTAEQASLADKISALPRKGFTLPSKKEWAAANNSSSSDDHAKALIDIYLQAKLHDVEVKNIDSRIDVDAQKMSDSRVLVTNYEWLHNIKQDRIGKEGKYIVFAGAAHMASLQSKNIGLVDDALGIPSIAFQRSANPFGFKPAPQNSGLDYTLNGGLDHPKLPLAISPAELPSQNGKATSVAKP